MAITIVQTAVTYPNITDAIAALPATFTEDLTIELSDASYTWAAGVADITGKDFAGFTLSIVGTLPTFGVDISIDGQISMQDAANIQNIVFENILFKGNFAGELFFIRYTNDFIFRSCYFRLKTHAQSIRGDAFQAGQSLIFEDCIFDQLFLSSENITQSYIYVSGTTGLIVRRSNIAIAKNIAAGSEFIATYNNTDTPSNIIFEDNEVECGWARLISAQGNHSNLTIERNKIVDNETSTQNVQLINLSQSTATRFVQNVTLRNNWIRVTRGTMLYFANPGNVKLYHNTFVHRHPSWNTGGNTIQSMSGDLSAYGNVYHFNQSNHPGGFTLFNLTAAGVYSVSRIQMNYNYIYSSAIGGNFITVNDQALLNIGGTGATAFAFNATGFTDWQTASGQNTNSTFLNAGTPSHTFTDFANDDFSILDGDILDDVIDITSVPNYSGGFDIQGFAREAASSIALGAFDPDAVALSANGPLSVSMPPPGYELTDFVVTVRDQFNAPVEGVTVGFNSATYLTDVNGQVTLTRPPVSTYTNFPITAVKSGYDDAYVLSQGVNPSQLSITVSSPIVEQTSFNVEIRDSSSALVQGASVTFNGDTQISDVNGEVTFTAPDIAAPTNYNITATAPELTAATPVSVTVNPLLQLVLTVSTSVILEGNPLTVTVTDENGDPVNTASVTLNGETLTPQAGNVVSFIAPAITTGSENFTITGTNAGYIDAVSIVLTVTGATLNLSVPATVNKNASFTATLTDSGTGGALIGYDLTFNGVTVATNAAGQAVFTAPDVLVDTVFAITGTYPDVGAVSQNITVDALLPTLEIIAPATVDEETNLTIFVQDENANPIEGASVFFHTGSQLTDVNGQVTFAVLPVNVNEPRTITATKAGYNDAIDVTITVVNIVLPEIEITAPASIQENQAFLVTATEVGVGPLQGATITFDGIMYVTDVSGQVNITAPEVLSNTNYTISGDKAGYIDAPDITILVQNYVTPTLTVTWGTPVYERATFTITVTDGAAPVESATAIFNGTTLLTDVNGQAVFTAPISDGEDLAIAVTKAGFDNYNDLVTIVNIPEVFVITYPANVNSGEVFTVNVQNNFSEVISGATVNIDSQNYTTDANGNASITAPVVLNTISYSFFVSFPGIPTANESINVLLPVLPLLQISAPVSVNEGQTFQVTISSEGNPVTNAQVLFQSLTLNTDASGVVTFTAPAVNVTTSFGISVQKTGYTQNNSTISVIDVPVVVLPDITINAAATVLESTVYVVTVTKENGDPLIGAFVTFNGTSFFSNSLGIVNFYTPNVSADQTFTVTASFANYNTATHTVVVENIPEPTLPLLTIIGPLESTGDITLIYTIQNANSENVFGSVVTFNGIEKATNEQGQVAITLPKVLETVVLPLVAEFNGYQTLTVQITVLPSEVVVPLPGDAARVFPVKPWTTVQSVNPAEFYQVLAYTTATLPSSEVQNIKILLEKQLNSKKYKLNSYLISESLQDHLDDLEYFSYQQAKYYLSEQNDLTRINEHLRKK